MFSYSDYQQQIAAAAPAPFGYVPILKSRTPAQWAKYEEEVKTRPSVWEEMAAPPSFDLPPLPKTKRRRDWKTLPRGEQVAAPGLLMYRAPERDAPLLGAQRRRETLEERVFRAEKEGWPTMTIASVRGLLPINGHFFPYLRHEGESMKKWRNRMRRMRSHMKYSEGVAKDEARADKPFWQQIGELSQRAGKTKANRFVAAIRKKHIRIVLLGAEESLEKLTPRVVPGYVWPRRIKTMRTTVEKIRKDNLYERQRLARKYTLALYAEERREFLMYRRERMRRVMLSFDNHQVQSLRAALECVAEQNLRQQFKKEQQIEGQGPCCSKPMQGIEVASECFDDTWEEGRFDNLPSYNWDEDNFPKPRTMPVKIYNMRKDIYQGHGPHDFHWAPYRQYPEGNMEVEGQDAQGSTSASTDKKSTVELQTQVGASVASSLPDVPKENVFSKFSNAESIIADKTFHDRWYTIHQMEWGSQAQGEEILRMSLPNDLLKNQGFLNSPSGVGFKQHMYWTGTLKIKIVANTNVRQYGQLQFSFYYGANQDSNFEDLRTNIYSCSQRLHALLTANLSNDVIIDIPFEFIFPVMTINRNVNNVDLGLLLGKVIVPLTAAANCPRTAAIKVLVSIENSKFSGMVGTDIARPVGQMFSAFASIVAAKTLLDKNRDAPSLISPGTPVIPINSSSWCMGSGQSTYNNVLRLNPNNVLPYPEGRVPNVEEMTVSHIKSHFGLVKILDWSANTTVGSKLWACDAAPVWDNKDYPTITHLNTECLIIPPVAVLSNLYCYWRGSLELRIDIVGATELSGSLMIAYIPRVLKDEEITMEQCYSCAHTIYDIHENRQIVFKIPYVASTMFYPRKFNVSEDKNVTPFVPPGSIRIFSYNKLIVNCTIPDNCKLICYFRGGDDFEVAVPATPSIGLSYQPVVFVPQSTAPIVINLSGYATSYSGIWRYCYVADNDKSIWQSLLLELFEDNVGEFKDWNADGNVPIIRYGGVSDHITQFYTQNFDIVKDYVFVAKRKSQYTKATFQMIEAGEVVNYDCKNFIILSSDGNYIYANPITDNMYAKLTSTILDKFNKDWVHKLTTGTQTLWYCLYYEAHLKPKKLDPRETVIALNDSDYWSSTSFVGDVVKSTAVPTADGDERTKVEAPVGEPQATAASNASTSIMGENFDSLKDLCRRFQLYAYGHYNFSDMTYVNWRTVVLRFPALPQGLQLDIGSTEKVQEYWNRTRDGPIPIIASGYRFFTGGLRYRVCFKVSSYLMNNRQQINDYLDPSSKIFVQHRPNIIPVSESVIVAYGGALGTDDLEMPGYAAYHQVESLNNILSIEIPFYMPSIRTYLQRANLNDRLGKEFSNLGEIAIGFTIPNLPNLFLKYDIYYSLADDAKFSVFVGFPPMINCSQIPDEMNIPKPSGFELIEHELDEIEKKSKPEANMSLNTLCLSSIEINEPYLRRPDQRYQITFRKENLNNKLVKRVFDRMSVWNMSDSEIQDMRNNFRVDWEIPVGLELVFPFSWSINTIQQIRLNSQKFNSRKALLEKININYIEPQGWLGLLKSGTSDRVDNVLAKTEAITEAIDPEQLKETTSSLSEITSRVKECLSSIVPSMETVESKFNKYMSIIVCGISQLVHCILNFNLKTMITAIISFFVQLKVISFSILDNMIGSLGKVFEKIGWCSEKPEVGQPEGNMAIGDDTKEEDTITSGYISSLIAGVAALFSLIPKFCKARYSEISDLIFTGLGKFAFTANHLFTFIKNNLAGIKRIGEYLFSDHPSLNKVAFLKDSECAVHEWAEQVIKITDPRRDNEVFTSTALSSQVYRLAYQAGILNIKMLDLHLTSPQSQTIQYLIKKINDLRDRLAKVHMAPPVKFEPFVFELTGNSGIGKSILLEELPYVIFKDCNMTHEGELVYHRGLGNAYWNNLRNQPVLIVDEKFPVGGESFLAVQLAELFQIKSRCIFNPPMADIPDKNIRYNPLIAMYASNAPFPELPDVLCAEAVYRRRDCLIEVALTYQIEARLGNAGEYNQLTAAEKGKKGEYSYLRFRFHKNPKKADNDHSMYHEWLTYPQFRQEIVNRFKSYYAEEEKKYREGLSRLNSVAPPTGSKSTIQQLFEQEWDKFLDSTKVKSGDDLVIEQMTEKIREELPPRVEARVEHQEIYRLNAQRHVYNILGSFKEMDKIEAKINEIRKRIAPRKENLPSTSATQTDAEIEDKPTGDMALPEPTAREHYKENVCIHEQLFSILEKHSVVTFNIATDNFEIKTNDLDKVSYIYDNIAMGENRTLPLDNFYYFFDNKTFSHSMVNGDHKIIILPKACTFINGSENPSCPIYLDSVKKDAPITETWKYLYMQQYIKCCPELTHMRVNGLDTSKRIPSWYDVTPRQQTIRQDIQEHEKHCTVIDTLRSWWTTIKETFYKIDWKKWLKRVGIALCLFTLLGTCFGLFRYFASGDSTGVKTLATVGCSSAVATKAIHDMDLTSQIKSVLDGEGHVSGDSKVSRQSVKNLKAAVKVISNPTGQPKGDMGVQNSDHLISRIKRNTFFLGVKSDNGLLYAGRCLGLCGSYALVIDHYVEAWQKACIQNSLEMFYVPMIDGRAHSVPIMFNSLKFIQIHNSALTLVKLPLNIPAFKDIRKLFLPKDQHKLLNGLGSIYEMVYDLDSPVMHVYQVNFKACNNVSVKGSEHWSGFDVIDGYEYGGFAGQGCCGAILAGSNTQSPIIGIHVAGYTASHWGYSDMMYREMFDNLGNQPDPVAPLGQGITSRWFVDAHVIGMGKVPARYAHMERGKSRITASEVQLAKEFPVLSQPAVLDKRDARIKDAPFSPMTEGCKYHGKPLKQFPEDDVHLVIEDVKRMILANCRPERKPQRLTVDEACGGFDGKPGYEHIEFKTSEGFPFVGMRPPGVKNKRWLFNFDEDNRYHSVKPDLKTVLDLKWQQRLNNMIPATIFTDCLKDCTLPHEKVLIPGKTRIFSMAPVDFTIQQRQCTLDFVVAFMVNRHKLEHMIGCNPDSEEWTILTNRLLSKGNNIITGDYSKYGDTLPSELIHGAFEIIRDWYRFNGCDDAEQQQQLKIMPYEIANSLHLMFDFIYQVVCGQPSGNSLTVILNSIVNSMYVRLSWLQIMRNTKFNSLSDFRKHCIICSYGDDLICSVSDDIKELFNGVSMQKFFESFGLKFTNADKSDTIVPYIKISEAEFLKRGFVDHPKRQFPQIILAPLKQESIEDTINWVWEDSFGRNEPGAPTFREMSVQVCEDSIRNAYSRGPEYYKYWSEKIQNFWCKRGFNLTIDTWDQMDYKIFDQEMDLSPYHKWCLNKFIV